MRSWAQSAILYFILATSAPVYAEDFLPSWNEGATKNAILQFVAKVTKEGSPDFVPPSERIAVFDNDGTLWCEQPIYVQMAFSIDRIKTLAANNPGWKEKQPFKGILQGNLLAALAGGEAAIGDLVEATHTGMTTEEFHVTVLEWLKTARHPRFDRPYTELVFQPMLELLGYLRANGFKTYIVSGGGVEFMRPWAEKIYGIPPEQVIGSSGKLKYEIRDNKPVLVKLPELDHLDDGPGKPVGIQKYIGRRPLAAFGNSDGDFQMLEWTTAGSGVRFGLIVHHTDADREWAYDRTSHVGKLSKGLDEASSRGWTVVDMKRDWKTIFRE